MSIPPPPHFVQRIPLYHTNQVPMHKGPLKPENIQNQHMINIQQLMEQRSHSLNPNSQPQYVPFGRPHHLQGQNRAQAQSQLHSQMQTNQHAQLSSQGEIQNNLRSSQPFPHSNIPDFSQNRLTTPREEWGTSHTPRSQLILNEEQASEYDLFNQQRLRLILKERERQGGPTLSPAASPGQALLTKELEANKERQKRQAIMQSGWRNAVDAMTSPNTVSNLITSFSECSKHSFEGILQSGFK